MDSDVKGMYLFLFLILLIGIPIIVIFGMKGFIPFGILWMIEMYFAIKVERIKKKNNIKTFKEIIAFSEGNANLEKLQKSRNNKDYVKEQVVIVFSFILVFSVLALIVGVLTILFMKL